MILFEDTWTDHILPEHSEMTHRDDDVMETIEDPLEIKESTWDKSTDLFLSDPITGASFWAGGQIVVTVGMSGTGGTVKTAYITQQRVKGRIKYRRK